MRRAGSLIIALFVATLGCQHDPHTARYASRQPEAASLVGSWRATSETLHDLARGPYATLKPAIELGADGVIHMNDLPDIWRDWDGQGLELSDGTRVYSGTLMVLGNHSHHRLVLTYGDPDHGSGYEFEKVQ